MTIFVSAGHHAEKQGAHHGWFYEYPEAIHWQHLLVEKLRGHGDTVPLGYLRQKVAYVNDHGGTRDLAVEVHFNAAVDHHGNPVGEGSETLYYPGSQQGQAAAEAVQDRLGEVLSPSRGIKEGWYRGDPDKGPIFFLARVPMPALIIEPEFVHRHGRVEELREEACEAIASALLEIHGAR
jgi:N-acetylmuramoyl-L-alanine amidase